MKPFFSFVTTFSLVTTLAVLQVSLFGLTEARLGSNTAVVVVAAPANNENTNTNTIAALTKDLNASNTALAAANEKVNANIEALAVANALNAKLIADLTSTTTTNPGIFKATAVM